MPVNRFACVHATVGLAGAAIGALQQSPLWCVPEALLYIIAAIAMPIAGIARSTTCVHAVVKKAPAGATEKLPFSRSVRRRSVLCFAAGWVQGSAHLFWGLVTIPRELVWHWCPARVMLAVYIAYKPFCTAPCAVLT